MAQEVSSDHDWLDGFEDEDFIQIGAQIVEMACRIHNLTPVAPGAQAHATFKIDGHRFSVVVTPSDETDPAKG